MSVLFPSDQLFDVLRERLEADPGCAKGVPPCDAYCGFAVDDRLFVAEFNGAKCAGTMAGGNELDLDFVLAGTGPGWRRALDAVATGDAADTLDALVDAGVLEIRSFDDDGSKIGRAALPLLQVFLERSRGLELAYD